MDMALFHPERVEKLVLLDSTGYPVGNALAEWLLMRNVVLPPALRLFGRPLVRAALRKAVFHNVSLVTEEEIEGWLHGALAGVRSLSRLREYNLVMEGEIPHISQPTLIIWGGEDRLMPGASGREVPRGHRSLLPEDNRRLRPQPAGRKAGGSQPGHMRLSAGRKPAAEFFTVIPSRS